MFNLSWDFLVDEMALELTFYPNLPSANHHLTTAPYPSIIFPRGVL
jgi:hypothetical protein